ncbi:MAG: Na/Pi cotransporter family protein [Spirochaetaceae bacterium]|nr:Na/Pi cotransporter family protein [Spirochaetaceae bacterium]
MEIAAVAFSLLGSLGFVLHGMKMMSDGIQKSASTNLRRFLAMMTGNRVLAVLTGTLITAIIQSSSATTVMVVSFVDAGLLTLEQSMGVIFGANIGTTVTAWIVSLFGFKFKISLFAVPLFGVGFFASAIRRSKWKNAGEALMGFGLLFLGLDLLSSAIPKITADDVGFLTVLSGRGVVNMIAGIAAGLVITLLIHSSAATVTIILTMANQGLLTWEFSAAMVLGSNIGTTIDAVMASFGVRINAKRAAFVHVMFNVAGTVIAAFFFRPLLALVDVLTPGDIASSITAHIAMLHTVFNVSCTILFLPFTSQIARLTEKIIPQKEALPPDVYKFEFVEPGPRGNVEGYIMRAEKEIADMTKVATQMFQRIQTGLRNRNAEGIDAKYMELFDRDENYADSMKMEISHYLVRCLELPMTERLKTNVSAMLRIVTDLEEMTDECMSVAILLQKSVEKNMAFNPEDIDSLIPYSDLAQDFLNFISENINKRLSPEQLDLAEELEDRIDDFRESLRKRARRRLEEGANVRSELLYIDLVRHIERIGDRAFSISESLAAQHGGEAR